jgi:hypothetical protein
VWHEQTGECLWRRFVGSRAWNDAAGAESLAFCRELVPVTESDVVEFFSFSAKIEI